MDTYRLEKRPGHLSDMEQAGILQRLGLTSYQINTVNLPMKSFTEIDPLTIQHNPYVVGNIVDNRKPQRTIYLLVMGDYALIAVCNWFTDGETGESEWRTYQLEMPKSGIPWIAHRLESKFFKLSHEGGLPADVRYYEEITVFRSIQKHG